jgi:hypothetical protein
VPLLDDLDEIETLMRADCVDQSLDPISGELTLELIGHRSQGATFAFHSAWSKTLALTESALVVGLEETTEFRFTGTPLAALARSCSARLFSSFQRANLYFHSSLAAPVEFLMP